MVSLLVILFDFLISGPLRLVLWGAFLKLLWASFIVTGFGAPPIGIVTAIGVLLVGDVITHRDPPYTGKDVDDEKVIGAACQKLVITIFLPLILGFFAVVLKGLTS